LQKMVINKKWIFNVASICILIVSLYGIYLFIKHNRETTIIDNKEGFQVTSTTAAGGTTTITGGTATTTAGGTTTLPILIKEDAAQTSKQIGNLIATHIPNNQFSFESVNLNINTGNEELPYKSEFQLKDTYIISQLILNDLLDTNTGTSVKLRIAVRNTNKNDLQYVNFAELLVQGNSAIDMESLEYMQKTKLQTATDNLHINKPTNIYGNALIGDRIILYTDKIINTTIAFKMYVFGYQEKDNYKTTVYEQVKDLPTTLALNTTYSELTTNTPGQASDNYLITSFKVMTQGTAAAAQFFKVVFRNNYSNDIITYPGPVAGYFIYDPSVIFLTGQVITLTSPIVATKFALVDLNNTDMTAKVSVSEIKGFTASIADINRFKLEYNITDIRSSINPDDVCPSIDKFVENQLSSELIIDAMDYQKKINDEKSKLQSNKDNLLNLLEQQDEIKQLSKLIGKIKDINTEREHQTNTINALQLFKQMNEYTKLKEVLDDRISLRKKNTFAVDVNVNKSDSEGNEPFINNIRANKFNLAPEDSYHIK
jgi:hypothetical protein